MLKSKPVPESCVSYMDIRAGCEDQVLVPIDKLLLVRRLRWSLNRGLGEVRGPRILPIAFSLRHPQLWSGRVVRIS